MARVPRCLRQVCIRVDDVQTFLILVEKVGKITIVGGTELRYLQKQALLYLETPVVVTAGQVVTDVMKSN